ncbi:MAG: hypothetical protein IIW46_03560 [Bacteroidaceae bacterium]|nr:hypothetical protein [Bacteroidaceae bacterium]
MNKFLFLIGSLSLWAIFAKAQITILNDDVQEKIVTKPEPFDSLSNIGYQKDPIQYRKYIGYKLYCLPISNKNKQGKSAYNVNSGFSSLSYKVPRKFVRKHAPFGQTVEARIFGEVSELKGNALASYKRLKENYYNQFITHTSVYKATEDHTGQNIYTPYDSIQNTYFTILNVEIADFVNAGKGLFLPLEDWGDRYKYYLRFTLKHDTSGEELYWICRHDALNRECFFLVPYFEKMQKMYKGLNVVATTNLDNLVDINNGSPVNIKAEEIWSCYDVTFVHSKDYTFIQPFFLLKKGETKVKIPFRVFTEKCSGMFFSEDRTHRQRFILEQDYNNLIAERMRSAEEKQRMEEERLRVEEQVRLERNKQIINKYGNRYGKLICEGQVCLNMTKEMCIEAWGEPNYINSTIIKGLVHEQWIYWGSYLYFDNGRLTGIQN